jgi:hypothetical protein
MGAIILQLAPFMIKGTVDLIKAIRELRQSGASPEAIQALTLALSTNIEVLDADTINTLAGIPLPQPK